MYREWRWINELMENELLTNVRECTYHLFGGDFMF